MIGWGEPLFRGTVTTRSFTLDWVWRAFVSKFKTLVELLSPSTRLASHNRKTRCIGSSFIEPLLSDGSKLPKRLEPLDSVVAYGNQTPMDFHALSEVKAAYAETGNGRIFTGTSQMLNHLVNVAKEGGINKA